MCAIRGNAAKASRSSRKAPASNSVPVDGALPVRRLAGKLAIAMNDFITEAWLANHTLSEGGEIHLPADARLTPSARELLESRHLRVISTAGAPVCRG